MEITEAFIEYWARGETASRKARALCGGLRALRRDENAVLFAAECPGSSAVPYRTAVDLRDGQAPRFRCDCPSRLRPCKHALGLLWAYVLDPGRFALMESETPSEAPSASPRKTKPLPLPLHSGNLREARSFLTRLLREGFDAQTPALLAREKKRLRELRLPPALHAALLRICDDLASPAEDRDSLFQRVCAATELLDRALRAAEDTPRKPDWELDTQLGRPWRLEDLSALGFARTGCHLIQLAFWSEDEPHGRRYTDIGLWAEPETARVYETRDYRPYAASRSLPPGDSVTSPVETNCAVCYPGSERIRWNGCRPLPREASALSALCRSAEGDARELCASLVRKLRDPAARPAALLRFRDMGKAQGTYYLRDEQGNALPLRLSRTAPSLLESVYGSQYSTCLLRFDAEDNAELCAEPLCLLSDNTLRRLI